MQSMISITSFSLHQPNIWSAGGIQSSPIYAASLAGADPRGFSEDFGGIVCQTGAFAAHQGDVPRVRPSVEPVDDISEPGGGLREVGGVDLRDIPQANHFGAGSGAGDQRLHLLGREILGLIDDDEAVQECSPAHE